ncbi:hypothetical protein OAS86_05215 [Gammaproteobacteria bacterium]|nr:hypothetical protein [Gammaproteobacteria bacterium]
MPSRHVTPLVIAALALIGLHWWLVAWPVWLRSGLSHHYFAHQVMVFDDAFYYLQPAWMWAKEGMLSMDGINPTNGYHPLWMIGLMAIASVVDDRYQLMFAALAVANFLYYASGVIIASMIWRLSKRFWPALLSLFVWLAWAQLYHLSITLLETPLWVFLALLSAWQVMFTPRVTTDRSSSVVFGATLGLLFLARTDSVFFIAIAWPLWLLRGEAGASWMLRMGISVGVAALVAVPWLVFSRVEFGAWAQTTSSALPWLYQNENIYRASGVGGFYQNRFLLPSFPHQHLVLYPLTLVLLLPALLLVVWRHGASLVGIALLSGALLLTFGYHYQFRVVQPWYLVLVFVLAVLLVGMACASCGDRWRSWMSAPAVCALLFAGALVWQSGQEYERRFAVFSPLPAGDRLNLDIYGRYDVARADVGLKPMSLMGHSDGGRFTFFAPDHLRVVNLDGLGNSSAYHAYRGGQMMDWLRGLGLDLYKCRVFICDYPNLMGKGFRRYLEVHWRRWIADADWTTVASVRKSEVEVENALRIDPNLPREISTATIDDYSHLMGTWCQRVVSERARQPLKTPGVQFFIEQRAQLTLDVRWLRQQAQAQEFVVFVDGEQRPRVVLASQSDVLQVPLGELDRGIHEIWLQSIPSSPPCGSGDAIIDFRVSAS